MASKENNELKDLIKEYGIKDMNGVHNFVKMFMAETIQTALILS
jgi:putative transposase